MSMTLPSTVSAPHTTSATMVGGAMSLPQLPALGIAEMMEYLGDYLNKSDGDIRTQMNEIRDSKADSEKLGTLSTSLQNIIDKADKDGWVRNPDAVAATRALLGSDPTLLAHLPQPVRDALNQLGSHLGDTTTTYTMEPPKSGDTFGPGDIGTKYPVDKIVSVDAKVSKDDLDGAMNALKTQMGAMASSNELKVIQLQSAISARGNLLSMVSNMVKSFDDNAKSIVGNMR